MGFRFRTLAFSVVLVATGMTTTAAGQPAVDEPLDPWRSAESGPRAGSPREIRPDDLIEPWHVPPPARPDALPTAEINELVDPWHGEPLHHRPRELPDPWGDEAPPTAAFPLVDLPPEPDRDQAVPPPESPPTTSRAAFPLLE